MLFAIFSSFVSQTRASRLRETLRSGFTLRCACALLFLAVGCGESGSSQERIVFQHPPESPPLAPAERREASLDRKGLDVDARVARVVISVVEQNGTRRIVDDASGDIEKAVWLLFESCNVRVKRLLTPEEWATRESRGPSLILAYSPAHEIEKADRMRIAVSRVLIPLDWKDSNCNEIWLRDDIAIRSPYCGCDDESFGNLMRLIEK